MSWAHPDWGGQEMDFVLSRASRGIKFLDPGPGGAHPEAVNVPEAVRALRDPKTRDATILKLVAEVGPNVLWPDPYRGDLPRNDTTARAREEVRMLARRRIESCYRDARGADLGIRRAARRFLTDFGKALSGNPRGRRGRADAPPLEVRREYYRYRFRLDKAVALFVAWPCDRSRDKKSLDKRVSAVAKACNFPKRELRSFLLDATGAMRPLSAKAAPYEQAQTWTGRKFGITSRRVANILAPSGVRDLFGSHRK
jgi:hypothetical protein